MASSLLSGERVVVLLYISRVFFSAPSSLYLESIALLLLALAGLFVEISAENSSALDRFKTRSDPFPLLPFSKTLACPRNSTVYLSKFQSVRVSGHESSSSSFCFLSSYPKDSEIGSWCNFVGCCLFCGGNGWMSYCSLEISLGFLICDTGL